MTDQPLSHPAGTVPEPDSEGRVTQALAALREGITRVDDQLLELLAERRVLARRVAETKAAAARSIRDQDREEDLLARLIEAGQGKGLDAHYVTRLFHVVIEDSVRLQQALLVDTSNPHARTQALRVAFQGDKGSYSYMAICQHFADRVDDVVYLGYEAFAEAVAAVEQGVADYAMLPIENTTSGGINEVYDLLMHTPLSVVGEETVRIDHCLLARPGVDLQAIERVYAHPQGFAQCSNYVREHLRHCRMESVETAEAVRRAAGEDAAPAAAIAAEQAGELFGLRCLARGIANQRENVTRFLCVSRHARHVPAQIASKTSLVMATSDAPGSLVEALALFRDAGLSMCKLESRPIMGNPWEEMFYVDVAANIDDEPFRRTLAALERVTRYLKVLGCYPANQIPATQVPPERWVCAAAVGEAAAAGGAGASGPGSGAGPEGDGPVGKGARPDDAAPAPALRLGNVRIGADASFAFIAGPAALHSLVEARDAARLAAQCGARALALGLHGARFGGPDAPPWKAQFDWLVQAARETGLASVVTVQKVDQVGAACAVADAVRIGGRDMDDVELLHAVGRMAKPVILTRGRAATLDDWLGAARTVAAQGNRQICLCDAGVNTPDSHADVALDLGTVAALAQGGNYPILVEPARGMPAGEGVVTPLVAAARAAGAHGCLLCFAGGASPPVPGVLSRERFADTLRATLAGAPAR